MIPPGALPSQRLLQSQPLLPSRELSRLLAGLPALSPRRLLIAAAVVCAVVWLMVASGLLSVWLVSDEYGHGLVVVAALAWLLVQRRHQLAFDGPTGWALVAVMGLVPLSVVVAGALAGIEQLQQYGLWLFLPLLLYAWGGIRLLRDVAEPLLALLLIIPVPYGVQVTLTAKLQLLSSELGAALIRAGGGVVHLAGNTIHMGGFTLLVDEACSGLRYLFSLMVIGVVLGFVLDLRAWRKLALVAVAVVVTVLLNGVRIAVTGLAADRYGIAPSQGGIHALEGWAVFMVALVVVGAVAALLARGRGRREPMTASPPCRLGIRQARSAAVMLLIIAAAATAVVAGRMEATPSRTPLSAFPAQLAAWQSLSLPLAPAVVQAAHTTDHYFGDLLGPGGERVNLYIGYYASQRQGAVPHSPLVCLPGDGWHIQSVAKVWLTDARGARFQANRVVSTKGSATVLAYFWIKQGGSNHASGLAARAVLLESALVAGRSDGALVRLVTEVTPTEAMANADARLTDAAGVLVGALAPFIPD